MHSLPAGLLALFFSHLCTANMLYEVDLIFPRNNSVFSAAKVPPVVWAIQNPQLGPALQVSLEWSVQTGPFWNQTADNGISQISGQLPLGNGTTGLGPPYLQYGGMDKLLNQEGRWWFLWQLCWHSCDADVTYKTYPRSGCLNDAYWFTTSNSAPLPDLVAATAADQCNATGYWALNASMTAKQNQGCAILGPEPTTQGNPCAVSINTTRAENITAALNPSSNVKSAAASALGPDHLGVLVEVAFVPTLLLGLMTKLV